MSNYDFDTEYKFTEPVVELYGELDDFVMVRLNEGKVQVRKVISAPQGNGEGNTQ